MGVELLVGIEVERVEGEDEGVLEMLEMEEEGE
jgi:hypothetical protein